MLDGLCGGVPLIIFLCSSRKSTHIAVDQLAVQPLALAELLLHELVWDGLVRAAVNNAISHSGTDAVELG